MFDLLNKSTNSIKHSFLYNRELQHDKRTKLSFSLPSPFATMRYKVWGWSWPFISKATTSSSSWPETTSTSTTTTTRTWTSQQNEIRSDHHNYIARNGFDELKKRLELSFSPEDRTRAERVGGTTWPASWRILISSLANLALSCVKNVMAIPLAPARPVRPILWM